MNRRNTEIIVSLMCGLFLLDPSAGMCQAPLDTSQWPAGVAKRDELDDARSRDFEFAGISTETLQNWLSAVNVELPVSLQGDLSGWMWVQRSSRGWFDFSGYRIEAAIRSAELRINGWVVNQAVIRLGFAKGDWYFGNISGNIASPRTLNPVGVVNAQARTLSSDKSRLQIAAEISDVRLRSLLQSFDIELNFDNSTGLVWVRGSTPVSVALDLAQWDATAGLDLQDVELPWLRSPGNMQLSVTLANANWEVTDSRLEVAGKNLDISGSGTVTERFPFAGSVAGRGIEIESLLAQLKDLPTGEKISGVMEFDANLAGDLVGGLGQAELSMTSVQLNVRDLPIRGVTVEGDYSNGQIQAEMTVAELAGGSLSGSVKWRNLEDLLRNVPSQAEFRMDRLDLGQLSALASTVDVFGRATGSLTFRTEPRPGIVDWESTGRFTISGMELAGLALGISTIEWEKKPETKQLQATATLQQERGVLQSETIIRFEDRENSLIRATRLAEYNAFGKVTDYRLSARPGNVRFGQLSGRFRGSFEINGGPGQWLRRGKVDLSQSEIAIEKQSFDLESAALDFDEAEIHLKRFGLIGANGRIHGEATLKRNRIGRHQLRLRAGDVRLSTLLQPLELHSLEPLGGRASLDLQLAKDATTDELLENWNGNWQGSLTELTFQRQPMGELGFQGEVVDRVVTAGVDGQLLGGAINGSLTMPLSFVDDRRTADAHPMDLRIQIDQAQGRQAAGLYLDAARARQLRGDFSVRLNSTGISPADLVTDAQIVLPLMELGRQVLTRNLTLRTRLAANRMTVQRLSGGFAQGRVDASGFVSFDNGSFGKLSQSEIHFVVQRLNAKQLLSTVDPELGQYIDGDVSYRGTAIYQQGIQTRGTATINDAAVAGIPIRRISGDVRVRIDNRGQFRSLIASDLHGNGVGGMLFGDLAIHARDRFAIHTSGRLQGGRLEELSKALGFPRIAGSGKFDANFKLQSTGVVSLQSLTGGMQIDFKNGDVGSVPILSLLNQFVPLTQFASTDFQNGRMRALIGQGQFRIRDLVLSGDAFSLLANGTAALDGSRLNIDAVLQTGGGAQQRLIQTALDRLLVGVAPPISAINQVNELVRNRSLFLHIGGSPSRPVIQARTGPTAVKAFLQNFARGLMGIPGFND